MQARMSSRKANMDNKRVCLKFLVLDTPSSPLHALFYFVDFKRSMTFGVASHKTCHMGDKQGDI